MGVLIAERLSVRLLIVQCSQFTFVCMSIRHTLIAWARFLWSRPQTTSHVVLVRPGGDRKIVRVREPKWSRGNMVLVRPGGDRRVKRSCESRNGAGAVPSVIVLESKDGNKGTLDQKRVRQRSESDRYSHDTSLTLWNASDHCVAIFTAIPHPQNLAPTRYTWLQRISTCIFSDILLREAYSAHAYS